MAFLASSSSSPACAFQFLPRPKICNNPFPSRILSITHLTQTSTSNLSLSLTAATVKGSENVVSEQLIEKDTTQEVELACIEDKALDAVEFTGSVSQAIPGPRVASASLPWILAIPFAYAAITFLIAFLKTANKFTSPSHKRKKLITKNAMLCKSIDELFHQASVSLDQSALKELVQKTGFSMEETVRKYIRYSLNEKPWGADLVVSLIRLRKASMVDDSEVAEILNEIARRIVRGKGPVVMDMSGFTEKEFKRKLAVQGLFGKVLYLSELPEFCSRGSSLIVKEIFGVTDEDTDKLRLHTFSEAGGMDSLEKMVEGMNTLEKMVEGMYSHEKTVEGSDSDNSSLDLSDAA